jgi:hypothetical protein
VLAREERDVQIEALLNLLALFILVTYLRELLLYRLIQFLAVLRINREISCLRTAKNYLFILAGIIYYVRVLRLKKLLLIRQRDEQTENN